MSLRQITDDEIVPQTSLPLPLPLPPPTTTTATAALLSRLKLPATDCLLYEFDAECERASAVSETEETNNCRTATGSAALRRRWSQVAVLAGTAADADADARNDDDDVGVIRRNYHPRVVVVVGTPAASRP